VISLRDRAREHVNEIKVPYIFAEFLNVQSPLQLLRLRAEAAETAHFARLDDREAVLVCVWRAIPPVSFSYYLQQTLSQTRAALSERDVKIAQLQEAIVHMRTFTSESEHVRAEAERKLVQAISALAVQKQEHLQAIADNDRKLSQIRAEHTHDLQRVSEKESSHFKKLPSADNFSELRLQSTAVVDFQNRIFQSGESLTWYYFPVFIY
jgi:hypothetical protein